MLSSHMSGRGHLWIRRGSREIMCAGRLSAVLWCPARDIRVNCSICRSLSRISVSTNTRYPE